MKLSKELYDSMLQGDVSGLEQIWDTLEGISYLEKEPQMKRLFFDMDGVLATWQEKLLSDFILPNGEILRAGTPVTDELWNNPTTHYYASIPPYEDFVTYVNEVVCIQPDVEVFVLSKSPSFAIKDKLNWIEKYLSNLPKDHIILCPYGEYPKTNFLNKITSNDYLFDDFSPNLREWEKAGGMAVNVCNYVNKIDKHCLNLPNQDVTTFTEIFSTYIFEDHIKKEMEMEK